MIQVRELSRDKKIGLLARAALRRRHADKHARDVDDPLELYGPASPAYKPQPKHVEVERRLKEGRRHNLLVGGSRSGKTFIFCKRVIERALIAPGSDHLIARFRGNAARASIWLGTLPAVRRMCFPRLRWEEHGMDGYIGLPGNSRIWVTGLDERERIEKILGLEFCVHPDSRILMSDLTWRRAQDVGKGDEIIAFPEELGGHMRLIRAQIMFNKPLQKRRYRVVTTKGETVVSESHKFVTYCEEYRRDQNYKPLMWQTVEQLKAGDKLRFAIAPWTTDKSYDGGWLAGIYDGEGWCNGGVGVSQNPGLVLEKIKQCLENRGFDIRVYGQDQGGECQMVCFKSPQIWQSLRLLGSVRPTRLLPKADTVWENRYGFNGKGDPAGQYLTVRSDARHVAEILSIEEIEPGEVRSIQTSSGTFIHDGFLGHNCTVYPNEASQIIYSSILTLRTRLAQVARCRDGSILPQQEFMDLNPVGKSHYSHREHIQFINPENRRPIPEVSDLGKLVIGRDQFYSAFLQPQDNAANLDPQYIASLANAPERYRKRFYEGQYVEDVEGALWTMEALDHARVSEDEIPETMDRVVVAVDPSGTDGDEDTRSDDVGIVVCGRQGTGEHSVGWLLDDLTCNEPPMEWGRRVVAAYRTWSADKIVAEANFGGEMVKAVIDAAARSMGVVLPPVELVKASRGKAIRAEPVSVLIGHVYSGEWQGDRVRHAGEFVQLEEELLNFSTFGYTGDKSPNRADAYVWGMTDLMLGEQHAGLWSRSDLEVVQ